MFNKQQRFDKLVHQNSTKIQYPIAKIKFIFYYNDYKFGIFNQYWGAAQIYIAQKIDYA